MRTIDQIADAVYENAVAKGFHAVKKSEDDFIEGACNNLHDEVSELHEAWRNGQLREFCDKHEKMRALGLPILTCLEEELADIVIRALDNARRLGVDIQRAIEAKHAFNLTRPPMHGGKKS